MSVRSPSGLQQWWVSPCRATISTPTAPWIPSQSPRPAFTSQWSSSRSPRFANSPRLLRPQSYTSSAAAPGSSSSSRWRNHSKSWPLWWRWSSAAAFCPPVRGCSTKIASWRIPSRSSSMGCLVSPCHPSPTIPSYPPCPRSPAAPHLPPPLFPTLRPLSHPLPLSTLLPRPTSLPLPVATRSCLPSTANPFIPRWGEFTYLTVPSHGAWSSGRREQSFVVLYLHGSLWCAERERSRWTWLRLRIAMICCYESRRRVRMLSPGHGCVVQAGHACYWQLLPVTKWNSLVETRLGIFSSVWSSHPRKHIGIKIMQSMW